MSLYRLDETDDLVSPILVAAFDGWVDAGSAATTAADQLARGSTVLASFGNDLLYDYRARRPTLEIRDGQATTLRWPELVLRHRRIADRDVLVLAGPEPDYRWRELAAAIVELARRLEVGTWLSLGAIPAAVPHTRPVTVFGTQSGPGLLRGGVKPGPAGVLTVPAAVLSVLDFAVARADIPAVGYFAQVPHYVSGAYPAAAVELLRLVGEHLDEDLVPGELREEAGELRIRLDAAAAANDTTRQYVERLEGMVDESRLPAGDDLIADIERFLRERGGSGTDLA
ncbi:MAG: PAC2 family protein [Chloroflexi bacterium]|nr:PAC2 family protein [Chloroflexota bacterium]